MGSLANELAGHGLEGFNFWPYQRKAITDKWVMLRTKTGGDVIFFIPGVHYALRDYHHVLMDKQCPNVSVTFECNRPTTFEHTRPMDHVLVPLKEVYSTLRTLKRPFRKNENLARAFWSVFPNLHDHKRRYSIHIDSYRCIEEDIRAPGWIERLDTPLFKRVYPIDDVPEDERAMMYYVDAILVKFKQEGCPMIEDWEFVTWNWCEPPAHLKSEPLSSSAGL
ncbi:hypothetical protein SLS62_000074 [Diatrype stigma]|uniref:Uncharacterized protein n=1 Tax=Diatrype stigma TaxID=117547 RepID=A0AAN9V1V3_9PEZI